MGVGLFADLRHAVDTLSAGRDLPQQRRGGASGFYEPDRRNSVALLIEYRERNRHVVPMLTFKRTLG